MLIPAYEQELVLICGAPGSGKSTLAKAMNGYVHVETDMFFVDEETREYRFNKTLLPAAYDWCEHCVENLLYRGHKVVVSNTFTRKWEREPYIKMAERFGIPIRLIHATGEYPNTHGVPDDVVLSMRQRFEPF